MLLPDIPEQAKIFFRKRTERDEQLRFVAAGKRTTDCRAKVPMLIIAD